MLISANFVLVTDSNDRKIVFKKTSYINYPIRFQESQNKI